jgi:hypothetical protein
MRRLLLLGTASALVVTACGAGASPAPRLSNVAAHARSGLHAIAAARRHAAGRKAQRLLQRVALPRRARRVGELPILSQSDTGVSILHETAWRHAFWRVRAPLASVYRFVKAHPARGFRYFGGGGLYRSLDFDNGVVGLGQRELIVDLARVGGGTDLRVEAGVAWAYPRSPREVVPAGTREIDIRDGRVRRAVTRPANVARIVRWFDALDVLPAAGIFNCPIMAGSRVTFVFRSAAGARLASAVASSVPATGCSPVEFTIGSERQKPLVDRDYRHPFISRVQRLLHLRFRRLR